MVNKEIQTAKQSAPEQRGNGRRGGRGVVREVVVSRTQQLSPHLKRVVLTGDSLSDFPEDQQGAYVKLRIDQGSEKLIMRSYTIQAFDPSTRELTLDFVVGQHVGPATDWADTVSVGQKVSIGGPGPRKMDCFGASTYLLVGDLTSINAVIAYANLIDSSATVHAFLDAPSSEDFLAIDWPKNVQVSWHLAEKGKHDSIVEAVKQMESLPVDTHVFIASEASVFRELRRFVRDNVGLPNEQLFASAYWKEGKDSDQLSMDKLQDTI